MLSLNPDSEITAESQMHETTKISNTLTSASSTERPTHNIVPSSKIIKGIDCVNMDQVLLDRNNMQQHPNSIPGQQTVENQFANQHRNQNQLPQLIICGGNQQDTNNTSQQQFKRIKSLQQRASITPIQNQPSRIVGQSQLIVKEGVNQNNPNENIVSTNSMHGRAA